MNLNSFNKFGIKKHVPTAGTKIKGTRVSLYSGDKRVNIWFLFGGPLELSDNILKTIILF